MKSLNDVSNTLLNLADVVQRLQVLPTVQPTISLADGLTTIKAIDSGASVRINFDLGTNKATWECYIHRFTKKYDAQTLEGLVAKIIDGESTGTPIANIQTQLHQLAPTPF